MKMTTDLSAGPRQPTASTTGPVSPRLGLTWHSIRRAGSVALPVMLLGLAVPYVLVNRYYMGMLLSAVILALLAVSIGFLARHLGLISLGHTAFFGGSAYAVGIAASHWGWSPPAAALFGFVAGTVIAGLMGALVVRSSGMGFLMLTLALGQALYQFSVQPVARDVTGAHDGLQLKFDGTATFLGLKVSELMVPGKFWPIAWVALVLVVFGLWALAKSRYGSLLEGMRENEERMRFSGFTTYLPRLLAFTISGAIASLGGVLFVLNAQYVSPETLSFLQAGDALVAAIIGGLGFLIGPVIGALLFTFGESVLNTGGNLQLYMGAALVLVLMFLPGGIAGIGKSIKSKLVAFAGKKGAGR
jgi:branched-chain amino acid transport system permease protein